jgi:hypothetical protein
MGRNNDVTIIHWTDPNYLDEYYNSWGSGQSVTQKSQADQTENPQTRPEPPPEPDPS